MNSATGEPGARLLGSPRAALASAILGGLSYEPYPLLAAVLLWFATTQQFIHLGRMLRPRNDGEALGLQSLAIHTLALLAVALVALQITLVARWNAQGPNERAAAIVDRIEEQHTELATLSARLAHQLQEPLEAGWQGEEWKRLLERSARRSANLTLFLWDPASNSVLGSSGPDVRHPLPDLGTAWNVVSSVTAVSRFSSTAIVGQPELRVVVARSDSTSRLPLPETFVGGANRRERVWTLRTRVRLEVDSLDERWFERVIEEDFLLRLRRDFDTRLRAPLEYRWLLAVGLVLLCLCTISSALTYARPSPDFRLRLSPASSFWTATALLVALGHCWRQLGGVQLLVLVPGILATYLVVVETSWANRVGHTGRAHPLRWFHGGLAIAVPGLLQWFLRELDIGALPSISGSIRADADTWALRLGCSLLFVVVVFCLARALPRSPAVRSRWPAFLALFLCYALLLATSGLVVWPATTLALLALAWIATGSEGWVARLLVSTMAAAFAMVSVLCEQQLQGRRALAERITGEHRVVDAASAEQFALEVGRSWRELELVDLAVGHPDSLTRTDDLGLALWEASPLASVAGLSALSVVDSQGAVLASFSYGLPLNTGATELEPQSRRWPGGPFDEWWNNAVAALETELFVDGRLWATAYLWLTPLVRPSEGGWQAEGGAVATDLLLGSRLEAWQLPQDGALVLVTTGQQQAWHRRIGVGRWRDVRLPEPSRVEALGDWAASDVGWVMHRELAELDAELFVVVPHSGWAAALVQAMMPAAAVIAVATVLLAAAGLLLLLISPSFRLGLAAVVFRYSSKLMLVVVALAVIPLAVFNLFLFQSAQQRSADDQLKAGETGLRASERLLAEYLPTVRPGYSLASLFEDGLFDWLPAVVGNELNLYWRGEILASSKPELLEAGLAPWRLPAHIRDQLAASTGSVAVRERRGAAGHHFEMYKEISIESPNGVREPGLVLSSPLLAQGRESAEQFESLAQQSLVFTVFLLLTLVVVARRLARNFARPIEQIVEGTARISEGASRLDLEPREPELAALVRAVDVMARRVATSREALMHEKELLEAVLGNVTSAVLAVDREGRVVVCNPPATAMMGVSVGDLVTETLNQDFLDELGADFLASPEIRQGTVTSAHSGFSGDPLKTEGARECAVAWVPTPRLQELGGVLIAEDITEVLRGQRLSAWAQMTRMIAHEIKNPLTPIRLSAEHLRRVHSENPQRVPEVLTACVENILEQVEELHRTASEFAVLHRAPNVEAEERDLRETVREVVDGYRHARDVAVELRQDEATAHALLVRHDVRLVARVLRNLIENAITASLRSAGANDRRSRVEVSCFERDGWAVVQVDDSGPGVEASQLQRIFEPNFSTKSGGTGLGLAISRRIAEEHGGTLQAERLPEAGLRLVLRLPGIT